jgi:hypothetical protein
MRKIYISVIIILLGTGGSAQSKKPFIVNPGQKIVEAIPANELYSYPEFRTGTVTLKNGTSADVKLNYNSVFGEMQFIDPKKGDTISLAEERNIKFITFEKDTFYFDEVWLQQIVNNTTMKVARKRLLEMTNKEKLGAMEVPGFGAIETYSKFTGSQHMKDLVAKERLTFTEHITYYFGDRFNNFTKANKKSLLNFYRGQEEQLVAWLKENNTDFSKPDDMKKLFDFLQTL